MPGRSGRTRRGRADDRKKRRTSVGGTSSHGCPTPRSCCVRSCHLHRRASGLRGDRAVRVGPARRRAAPTPHPAGTPGAGLLPAGGAGAALVSRRHPAGPAGRRQPDRPLDGLPLSARGHRRARRGRTRVTRRAAGRSRRRPSARDGGWHADPHRSLSRAGSDRPGRPLRSAGGPVVVGQARRPRRQRAGRCPDGWPLWTSAVRPGREHDTTALRTDAEALPLLAEWTDEDHAALADLGYEGERAALTTPIKKNTDAPLTDDQRTVNLLHAATRAPAERGNSLLKTTFKALRRVSLCPWRIGAIIAAALVLLHNQHDRTT